MPEPKRKDRPLDDPELAEALGAFETALATPIVPGELEPWAETLQAKAKRLEPLLHRRIADHEKCFSQIEKADPELIKRVENLKSEDEEIHSEFQSLSERIASLAERAPDTEPGETVANRQVPELVDNGLAFVIRVRKQEVALRTWLVEAFQRDRGPVD